MEHAILPLAAVHEQVKPPIDALEHVADVAGGEDHAFGFARSSRGVDDGDGVGFGECGVSIGSCRLGEDFIEQDLGRGFGPFFE